MFSSTIKSPSSNPIAYPLSDISNADDNYSDAHRESSPLTLNLHSVGNQTQTLLATQNVTLRSPDSFLTRLWHSFQPSGASQNQGNVAEEGTELIDILSVGEDLRRQAETLETPGDPEAIPQDWKGSFLKRSLIGAGILTGAGILGGASYRGYAASNFHTADPPKNSLRGNLSDASVNALRPSEESGGTLGNAFGNPSLPHHDDPGNNLRHRRRHLSLYNRAKLKLLDKLKNNNARQLSLPVKQANHRITQWLRGKSLLETGKVNKESLLSAVAEYMYTGENETACHIDKIRELARNILAANELWGGKKMSQFPQYRLNR